MARPRALFIDNGRDQCHLPTVKWCVAMTSKNEGERGAGFQRAERGLMKVVAGRARYYRVTLREREYNT
eukprot:scaffold17030_cov95-Skeletonema_dohrnii-CCMP3373.AAC.1